MAGKLTIKLVRSTIGCSSRQRQTVRALGLRKINDTVQKDDTPEIRGMLRKVQHLVEIDGS